MQWKRAKQAKQMIAYILKDANGIDLKDIELEKYLRIAADVIVDGESSWCQQHIQKYGLYQLK